MKNSYIIFFKPYFINNFRLITSKNWTMIFKNEYFYILGRGGISKPTEVQQSAKEKFANV